MATVQNLERLKRLLESLEGEDSLEAAVASERLNAMILRTQQVDMPLTADSISTLNSLH